MTSASVWLQHCVEHRLVGVFSSRPRVATPFAFNAEVVAWLDASEESSGWARSVEPAAERGAEPHWVVRPLDLLADLLVEAGRERLRIARRAGTDGSQVSAALERMIELERLLKRLGVEAARVDQARRQVRLISSGRRCAGI